MGIKLLIVAVFSSLTYMTVTSGVEIRHHVEGQFYKVVYLAKQIRL